MKNRILSFKYALQGIALMVRSQPNFRIHLAAAAMVILLGFWICLSTTEWLLVVFAIGMVLAAEGFNTAIENLVDLVSPEHHELAGNAKDAAAGGVLWASLAAAVIGGIIFLPKLLRVLLNL